MYTEIIWILAGTGAAILILVIWLYKRERKEIATWDDSHDGWPDEEDGSMD